MLELNKIYSIDCLKGMAEIDTGSIDAIICDLPYGTMKGINERFEWDNIIDTDKLFSEYGRILRKNGVAILFSQEPYTSHLRTFKNKCNLSFSYSMIWIKNKAGNQLMAKTAPVSFFEDLSVFHKRHDDYLLHPLREYALQVLNFIGCQTAKGVNDILGHRKAEHFFMVTSFRKKHENNKIGTSQFALCTNETYNELIKVFNIDKMQGFKPYDELKETDRTFNRTFNLPYNENSLSNVFYFDKENDNFHPTQKPVNLIRKLIVTYTNENDLILDNCMGSGTTAVAAIKEKRRFIGFETDINYFNIANKRIKNARQQLSLF